MGTKGSVSARLDAPPDVVFACVTDIARLARLDRRLEAIAELPDHVDEGAEWVVFMRLTARRVRSRSHVIELDRAARRFVLRSKQDDDRPAFTIWTWSVASEGDASRVTLAWDLRAATLLRKRVVGPIRSWWIECREAPATLAALARAVAAPSA
jgi:hypothetical protein